MTTRAFLQVSKKRHERLSKSLSKSLINYQTKLSILKIFQEFAVQNKIMHEHKAQSLGNLKPNFQNKGSKMSLGGEEEWNYCRRKPFMSERLKFCLIELKHKKGLKVYWEGFWNKEKLSKSYVVPRTSHVLTDPLILWIFQKGGVLI